jgi:hypothetical protein
MCQAEHKQLRDGQRGCFKTVREDGCGRTRFRYANSGLSLKTAGTRLQCLLSLMYDRCKGFLPVD